MARPVCVLGRWVGGGGVVHGCLVEKSPHDLPLCNIWKPSDHGRYFKGLNLDQVLTMRCLPTK